jgi:hypothetical protein
MDTIVISQTNNSTLHIKSYRVSGKFDPNFLIKETGETFRTHKGAFKRCRKLLKKDRDEYYKTHPKRLKRRRTKPVKTEVKTEKNVWTQVNIG